MKTLPLPILHFSGYPLPLAEIGLWQAPGLTGTNKKKEKFNLEKKETSEADIPENWDESWFANYE